MAAVFGPTFPWFNTIWLSGCYFQSEIFFSRFLRRLLNLLRLSLGCSTSGASGRTLSLEQGGGGRTLYHETKSKLHERSWISIQMTQILKPLKINVQFFTCDKANSYKPLLKWQYWAQHTSSVLNFHGVYCQKTSQFLGVFTAQFTYELPLYFQSLTPFRPFFKTTSFFFIHWSSLRSKHRHL